MGRILKPMVRGGGWYPSKKWIPLVRNGGYTTQNGGETEPVWATASGAIASFTTPFAYPLKKLVAEINPVQDLRGQDAPYPAGGGVNKFDGQIEQGALDPSTGEKTPNVERYRSTNFIGVKPSTRYRISVNGTATSANIYSYDANKTFLSNVERPYTNDFTTGADTYFIMFFGTNALNSDKVQIEEGSSVTAWTPYSNICPISGWTGLSGQRTGKNLLDLSLFAEAYPDSCSYSNDTLSVSNPIGAMFSTGIDCFIPAYSTINATITAVTGTNIRLRVIYADGTAQDLPQNYLPKIIEKDVVSIRLNWSNVGSFTISNAQAELGRVATEYEPFTGEPISVSFGQTVYGGTDEVIGGNGTSTFVAVDLGELSYSRSQSGLFYATVHDAYTELATGNAGDAFSDTYIFMASGPISGSNPDYYYHFAINNSNILYISDPRYADTSEFKAAMAGSKIIYRRNEPQSFTHTGQSVDTLAGQNNVWVTSGDVEVTYRIE